MIKVKELMINDWVKLNNSNYQVQVIKKKGVIKLYENTKYGEHEIELNTDWIEEFIEPIPLTEEILKKNGFLEDSNGIFYLKENLKFGFKKDIDYGCWFINRADNYKEYICTCDSVHELQHILKLQQIEKEIIL